MSALDPRMVADRLTGLRADLLDIANDLHHAQMPNNRERIERAADEVDYAVDSLMALARGDDGQQ